MTSRALNCLFSGLLLMSCPASAMISLDKHRSTSEWTSGSSGGFTKQRRVPPPRRRWKRSVAEYAADLTKQWVLRTNQEVFDQAVCSHRNDKLERQLPRGPQVRLKRLKQVGVHLIGPSLYQCANYANGLDMRQHPESLNKVSAPSLEPVHGICDDSKHILRLLFSSQQQLRLSPLTTF
jgi:hypothetical protein